MIRKITANFLDFLKSVQYDSIYFYFRVKNLRFYLCIIRFKLHRFASTPLHSTPNASPPPSLARQSQVLMGQVLLLVF